MSQQNLLDSSVPVMNIVLQERSPEGALAERELAYITRVTGPSPGFAGPGHTAIEVFTSEALSHSDPFVLLMDDTLDFLPGQPVGDPHPHAGLETVTLVLEGALDDAAEGLLQAGDMAWMSAGRGIVHNEATKAMGRARILQLWLALPRKLRWSNPELQLIPYWSLPVRRAPGVECRLYSGMTGDLVSTTKSQTPCIFVDIFLGPASSVDQWIPGSFTTFLYVIEGSIEVAGDKVLAGEVGWLNRMPDVGNSGVHILAGDDGARIIVCAAQPLLEPLVHQGPFVAGTRQEISDYYANFMAGGFRRVNGLATGSTNRTDGGIWLNR